MQDPYCAQSYEASDTPETVLREGCTVKMEDLTSEAGKAVNGKAADDWRRATGRR